MTDALTSLPLLYLQNLTQPLSTQISASAANALSNFRRAENYLNSL